MVRTLTSVHGLFIVILTTATGCGGGPVPVEGILQIDGKPLGGATITFLPESPGGREAHAFSKSDGSFTMSTTRPGDGVLPGEYKLIVSYAGPPPEMPPATTQEEAMKALTKAAKTRKRPPVLLPDAYTNPAKTKLRQKVPPEGPVRLELRSKG